MFTALFMLLMGLAQAGEWAQKPIDTKVTTNGTAYTIGKGQARLGAVNQDFGLLHNTSIGTTLGLWPFYIPNAHTKITAIQTPKLDVALDAGWLYYDLDHLNIPNSTMTVTPVGWTGSWTPHQRVGVHAGTGWILASANGRLSAVQIAKGVYALTGANIKRDLVGALGNDGGVYAGANLTMFQTRFGLEYRLNRRDAIVFRSTSWLGLRGLIAAGVAVNNSADVDLEIGGSARIHVPLRQELPSLTTLSWQWSWRRVQAKVGIPLPVWNYYAYVQAIDIVVLLGPERSSNRE